MRTYQIEVKPLQETFFFGPHMFWLGKKNIYFFSRGLKPKASTWFWAFKVFFFLKGFGVEFQKDFFILIDIGERKP